jgi:hypothetical protein
MVYELCDGIAKCLLYGTITLLADVVWIHSCLHALSGMNSVNVEPDIPVVRNTASISDEQKPIAAPQLIASNWSTQDSFAHFWQRGIWKYGHYRHHERQCWNESTYRLLHANARSGQIGTVNACTPTIAKVSNTNETGRIGSTDAGVHIISYLDGVRVKKSVTPLPTSHSKNLR